MGLVAVIGAVVAVSIVGCNGEASVVRGDSPEEMLGRWRFTVAGGGLSGASTYDLHTMDYGSNEDGSPVVLGSNEFGGNAELTWIAVTQQWRLVDFVMPARTDVFIFVVRDRTALGDYYQFVATSSGVLQLGPIPCAGTKLAGSGE